MFLSCFVKQRLTCKDSGLTEVSPLSTPSEGSFSTPIIEKKKNSINRNDEKIPLKVQDLHNHRTNSEEVLLLREHLTCLTNIKNYVDGRTESSSMGEEWKTLARILDRFFIVAFLIAQIISTIIIMLRISQ